MACHKRKMSQIFIAPIYYSNVFVHNLSSSEDVLPYLSHILIILWSFADTVLTSTGSAGAVVLGRCAVSVTPLVGAPDGGRVA